MSHEGVPEGKDPELYAKQLARFNRIQPKEVRDKINAENKKIEKAENRAAERNEIFNIHRDFLGAPVLPGDADDDNINYLDRQETALNHMGQYMQTREQREAYLKCKEQLEKEKAAKKREEKLKELKKGSPLWPWGAVFAIFGAISYLDSQEGKKVRPRTLSYDQAGENSNPEGKMTRSAIQVLTYSEACLRILDHYPNEIGRIQGFDIEITTTDDNIRYLCTPTDKNFGPKIEAVRKYIEFLLGNNFRVESDDPTNTSQ